MLPPGVDGASVTSEAGDTDVVCQHTVLVSQQYRPKCLLALVLLSDWLGIM